ncbi:hypothetical protein [Aquimonas voraii]|uniref:Uncharacterized protein n=1 Tax=Aquimonas voraii TaxID=265719 RepID=A0A1G6W2H8_9GAMM|nr:hypothetical protein [Aquimonas voraii]SDD60150.1 hypothetical protein SAMN04488509_10498 [Aquimonas voraii]
MTDAPAPRRLAELYRAAMAQSPAADAEALLSALDGRGSRESRDEILSLAAQNPTQAAVLRTLVELRSDVDLLQREVAGLRRRSQSRTRPVWAALAASCALAAVVAFGLGAPVSAPTVDDSFAQQTLQDADRISAVSFEGPAEQAAEAPLFSGSFDS